MSNKIQNPAKKSISADWLVRGILTRIGETFDRLTGRNWKPSSSLATSELSEKLKQLLDAEARDIGGSRKFVPHNIKLKMQWDKFSTDAESSIKKLEDELLIAAIDHINDRRYYTYAPMKLEIKPDYFTEGVKLLASFDKFGDEDAAEREAAINVSIPDLKNVVISQTPEAPAAPKKEIFVASFIVKDKPRTKELAFAERQRLSVGRTKENDLWLDDASVSKIHAALILNSQKQLVVADTGSTNGTFVNDERIAYGRAFAVKANDKLRFGTVEVALEHVFKEVVPEENYLTENTFAQNDFAPPENHEVKTEVAVGARNFTGEKTLMIDSAPAIKTDGAKTHESVPPTESRIVLETEK